LDPAKPIKGQSANLNTSQNEMMDQIRADYGIKGGNVVKGHLLNDNLGGNALSTNLYPITKAANSAHLGYVENIAKLELWKHGKGIYYSVEVDGVPKITKPHASFVCQINHWDPATEKVGDQIAHVSVNSNLEDFGSKGAYHDVEDMESGEDLDREKNPRKPPGFHAPSTSVGGLSADEERLRNKDNDKTLGSDLWWQKK
ncbi:MAG TPA: hypothetical protein VFJ43_10720, partial [Bacteroidia bacterium]|nr:hypothetical protein [Bacteroidia bacterium]